MLELKKFIPKTIKNREGNREYKIYSTTDKIPGQREKMRKDEIGIWYEAKTPSNGRIIHRQILPRFIKEDKILYESIGLYLAEGGLSISHNLNLGNDEPEVINTIMKSFQKHFKVPFLNWSWAICFNEKLRRVETKKITSQRERASINFWLNKTKIRPKSTAKTSCRYSNKNTKGKLKTKKKWGSLNIVYGNKILKNLWLKIMDTLVQKTLQNRKKSKAAFILRGWIAGDGYCRYDIYDKPRRELGITCKDKGKLQILYKLFGILGIKPQMEKNGLKFTKAEFLIKAYNYKLTVLNLPKHLNLLKSLLSYKRIPEAIKKVDLKKIEKELSKIELKIKNREELFEKLKDKRIPKLREGINWQFLINGLFLKKRLDLENFKNEIGCTKTVLIKWLKKGVEPSRKYKMKILQTAENYNKEKLIKFGEFFLRGNWGGLLEGLQIFFKASRSEIAEKIGVHVGTIESIINQRTKLNRDTASRILDLLEKYEKTPEEIARIYRRSTNIEWSEQIRRILIEKEWSQQELATTLECSRSLVREWLGGLEPSNKYKGKLIGISKYNGRIRIDL